MPSYLVPARESFIPTQLYQPDFESIGGILRNKQMQYDQGYNQLKSTFNSILNAPLTVDENKIARQGYIDQAREQLKNLPKADLSIQQVQSQANQVFNPFYEDSDIVKDMVKTKQFNQQFQFAENLRNSKKPEEQAQYWDMGVQYLANGIEKLRTAKRGDGSIDKVEPRRYVSYFDSQKFLDEEAKVEGLKIERETSNGQYKLTRINGDEAVPLFETWATSKLGNNNKANDMFRVEGTVLYENQLNNLVNNGVPPEVAKSTLADNYLQRQAARYKSTVDKLESHGKTLKADIEAQRILIGQMPSSENLIKLEGLLKQYQNNSEAIPKYQDFATKFNDKESKDYKDVFNSLMNNGEAFFAEHSRDNFIDNWSKGRAANSSVKYDIDPGFKLNLELEKEIARMKSQESMNDARITKIVDGVSYAVSGGRTGSGGSGSGSGNMSAGEAKLAALNTPVPVGLNVGGKDKVSVFNRFVAAKKESLDAYINSGLKFVEQMSFNYGSGELKTLSGNYLGQLKDQITRGDGQFVPNEAAKNEHKQLQDAGVIPKDIPYGAGPIRTFNAIKDYYSNVFVKQLKDGVAKPDIIRLLDNEEYNSKKYSELKSIEDKELATLKSDPNLADIFKGDNVVSFKEYIKSKGMDLTDKNIERNYNTYLNGRRFAPGRDGLNIMNYDDFKKQYVSMAEATYKKDYDSKINTFKTKFGKSSISNGNEAYIGPGVQFEAGDKDDETIAKRITSVVMGDENFTDQNISKDGILPANITQLEELGADRKEVAGFLGRIQNNARDLISRIGVTKIGSDGKPTVKLYLKASAIDDYSNKDKNQLISQATANALGKGIEITVNNPELLKSQGLNLDFTPSSIDQLTLRKEGVVEAPKVLKQAGFDYTISPSVDGQNLLVKFNYKLFKNGNFDQPQFTTYQVPIGGSSIEDIRTKLFNTAMDIYNSNYTNSSQYYKQNPQVTGSSVDELMKKYNYK